MKHPEHHRDETVVRQLFAAVAERYDLMNTLLTLNLDTYWRRRAVFHANLCNGDVALDVCCGTGKLTQALARKVGPDGTVVGVDFSPAMLARAQAALHGSPYLPVIQYLEANALHLPFPDNRFDCTTIAFGLRNVADIAQTVKEMVRVTKADGSIVILELARPRLPILRQGFHLYTEYWLPAIGNLGRQQHKLYQMVPASLKTLPEPEEICSLLRASGLRAVRCRRLTGGLVALYTARKDPTIFTSFQTAT